VETAGRAVAPVCGATAADQARLPSKAASQLMVTWADKCGDSEVKPPRQSMEDAHRDPTDTRAWHSDGPPTVRVPGFWTMTGKAYSPAAGRQAASCSQPARPKAQVAHLSRAAKPALSADARQAQVAASLGQIRERHASLVSARRQQIGRSQSSANRSTAALQRVKAGQATQPSASAAQLELLRQAAEVRSFVTSCSRVARSQSVPSSCGGNGGCGCGRGPSAEVPHEHPTLPDTPAPEAEVARGPVRFAQQEAESRREDKERGREDADEGARGEEESEVRHLTLDALSAEALKKMARHYGTDWSGCVGKRDLVALLCRPGALPQDFWFEVQEAGRRAQELYAKATPLAQQVCRAAGGSRRGCGGGRGGCSGGGDGGSSSGGSSSRSGARASCCKVSTALAYRAHTESCLSRPVRHKQRHLLHQSSQPGVGDNGELSSAPTASVGARSVQTVAVVGAVPRATRPRSAPIKPALEHKAARDAELEADLRKLGLGGRVPSCN
jgi:hypothetical protein